MQFKPATWPWTVLVLSATLLLATLFTPDAGAQDASAAGRNALLFPIISKSSSLSLVEKGSRVLSLEYRIKTVDGFDPAVVKVTTISDPEHPELNDPRKIRVQAMAPGVTTLLLVDERGESYTVEVLVSGDVKQLEAVIRRAFPDASVQAVKVKDSVLLLGWVNQPDQLTTIIEIAEQFHPKVLNYLRVSGIQQVLLQVKIMEVQRGRIRTMGFNFLNLRDGSYISSTPGNLSPLTSLTAPFGGPAGAVLNPGGATAAFGLISNDNIFQGFIEALKSESLLKVLAEPNLVTVNGRPANFLSGGEFPILVPGGLGTVTVQFKPFGVRLEFVPVVLGNGRVRLEVAPEVSEKDVTSQVQVGTTFVPGLKTRRANAQVEMNFGQTLVLAGLISNSVTAQTQKVPFLGELPWVGAAFRRVSHNEAETELLIMVTPQLVEPLDAHQVPPYGPGMNTVSPTDRELFGSGYIETPRYGPDPSLDNGHPRVSVDPLLYGTRPSDQTAGPMTGPASGPLSGPAPKTASPPPPSPGPAGDASDLPALPPPLPPESTDRLPDLPPASRPTPLPRSEGPLDATPGPALEPPPTSEANTPQAALRRRGAIVQTSGTRLPPRPGPIAPTARDPGNRPRMRGAAPGPISSRPGPTNARPESLGTRPGPIAP